MFKGLDRWLPEYLLRHRPPPVVAGVTDVMLCICDHFEPFHAATKEGALARMALWKCEYTRLCDLFRDSDGCRPRHTFFYPIEQYDREILDELAEICRLTESEVEIHLHHDRDTAENLRATLERGKQNLREHGLLSVDETGRVRYGFVHGDWALDDSHPAGRHCGVRNELTVLQETGCYADFTMPSAPSPTQTQIINSIYYAQDTPAPKSHNSGTRLKVGQRNAKHQGSQLSPGELLLVQGPLGLNFERRKFGILPRIENADLTGANPPRADRLRVWLKSGVHVIGRPEWLFVKLHTHGAIPQNSGALLGEPMRQFHTHLKNAYNDGARFRFHYVTARETVNLIYAAEHGCSGDPGKWRNYLLTRSNS